MEQLSGTLCIFVSLGDSLSFAPSSQSPPPFFLTGDYFQVHSSLRILEGRLLEEKAVLSLGRMKATFKLRLEDSLRFGKKLLVPPRLFGNGCLEDGGFFWNLSGKFENKGGLETQKSFSPFFLRFSC